MSLQEILAEAPPPPNAASDDRLHRLGKRLHGFTVVMTSADYGVATGSALPIDVPTAPDPYDPGLSKRQWEARVMKWRNQLRVLRQIIEGQQAAHR